MINNALVCSFGYCILHHAVHQIYIELDIDTSEVKSHDSMRPLICGTQTPPVFMSLWLKNLDRSQKLIWWKMRHYWVCRGISSYSVLFIATSGLLGRLVESSSILRLDTLKGDLDYLGWNCPSGFRGEELSEFMWTDTTRTTKTQLTLWIRRAKNVKNNLWLNFSRHLLFLMTFSMFPI